MEKNLKISIIGGGSWGTTLSAMLAEKGYIIKLWVRNESTYNEIKKDRKNKKYTSNLELPANVKPFLNKKEALNNTDLIIFAVPSHTLRSIIKSFYNELLCNCNKIKAIINVAKGFETGTNLRLSQVMQQCVPEDLKSKIVILSGPNIALEVANKLPSVTVISSLNVKLLNYLQPIISTDYFRVYTNIDIIGVEVSGAVKNIIAIASGISDSLGYGANTKASLVTRGLYELSKFGTNLGANPQTFAGAAGMGDLVATCISRNSRNREVGERLGGGEKINEILSSMFMIAEGVKTTKAVYEIAKIKNIDVPITNCVYEIIYNNLDPVKSVNILMKRKFKSEV
jgi:glycerol-3-phosphate dehydrogenase (NAD(P)+)